MTQQNSFAEENILLAFNMEVASFRAVYVTVILAFLLSAFQFTSAESDELQHSPVVQTESGSVVGKIESLPHGKSVHEYLGIAYAEPPVGDLRFAAPKPVKPWSGIREATAFGKICPQPDLVLPNGLKLDSKPQGEDCLSLNVYVPSTIKPNDKLAVMVGIHGGAFSAGSSIEYPGGVFAAFNDVILVTINYRLGVLGFFNIPGTEFNGNYGILDQIQALKWVQANIAGFGGDPGRVTIFGESSGARSVSFHLISPLSKDLFHRAIAESGASSAPLFFGKVKNSKVLEKFADLVNCTNVNLPQLIECVRDKSVEDILLVQSSLNFPVLVDSQDLTGPVVDGEVVPDLPENLFKNGHFHRDVDVITGFNSDEGALLAIYLPPDQVYGGTGPEHFESIIKEGIVFAREINDLKKEMVLFEYTDHADPTNRTTLRQSMMDCFGDSGFIAPVLQEAKALAKAGRPPYVYVFDHRPVYTPLPEWFGVVHGLELGFVFGAPFQTISASWLALLAPRYSDLEKGFSLQIMKMWTDFAKTGSPTSPDSSVTWPLFTEEEQAYLVLDLKPRVERRFRADKVAFWNELIPKLTEVTEKDKKGSKEKTSKDEL